MIGAEKIGVKVKDGQKTKGVSSFCSANTVVKSCQIELNLQTGPLTYSLSAVDISKY